MTDQGESFPFPPAPPRSAAFFPMIEQFFNLQGGTEETKDRPTFWIHARLVRIQRKY